MKNRTESADTESAADGWYRLAETVVAIIGIREGLVAVFMRLIGRTEPSWLSLPLYLPNPWCYLVAAGVVVAAFLALVVLDKARLAASARTSSET
ncbi:MAG TPA: hypothetical protein VHZ97_04830 [Pseudonocardiaceae bacterium]|jgi:predicted membrane channel-forming protein YqfA (hemolysin III family)|nr:hypothetical protein [Pseudonocardiaceae bacterium]